MTLQEAIKTNVKKQKCHYCDNLNVEAHHYNYEKYNNIIWVCRGHHNDLHTGRIAYQMV